jgi:hypothetical protein
MKIFGIDFLFVFVCGILTCGGIAFAEPAQNENSTNYNLAKPSTNEVIEFTINTEGHEHIISIPVNEILFKIKPFFDQTGLVSSFTMQQNPDLVNLYNTLGYGHNSDNVFIYPIFTQAAYDKNGFYDYYNKKCDSKCLTVPFPVKIKGTYSSSITGAFVLTLLGYSQINDLDVDKNPDILKQYKRVIILHNEYVTKKEFDAINNHHDVVYLYPNALYAEVKTDYNNNAITLVRGHGYPTSDISNGFGWKSTNSKYEYDADCDSWTFYTSIENKTMLNCYPEYRMLYDSELLRYLTIPDPTVIPLDVAQWLRFGNLQKTHALLADFDVKGDYIPGWVSNPAIWLANGEITKIEFGNILRYLYDSHIIK